MISGFSFQRGRIDVKTTSCQLLSELHSPLDHARIVNLEFMDQGEGFVFESRNQGRFRIDRKR